MLESLPWPAALSSFSSSLSSTSVRASNEITWEKKPFVRISPAANTTRSRLVYLDELILVAEEEDREPSAVELKLVTYGGRVVATERLFLEPASAATSPLLRAFQSGSVRLCLGLKDGQVPNDPCLVTEEHFGNDRTLRRARKCAYAVFESDITRCDACASV